MCGIFFSIKKNNNQSAKTIHNPFELSKRGPDNYNFLQKVYKDFSCDFHFFRLSIINSLHISNQPIILGETILIANAEIFNYKELISKFSINNYHTLSDCEIISHLYLFYKNKSIDKINIIKNIVNEIDGEFAFILHDTHTKDTFCVRDNFGVRPLYIELGNDCINVSSELKGFDHKGTIINRDIEQIKNGQFYILHSPNSYEYHNIDFSHRLYKNTPYFITYNIDTIKNLLYKSVEKRIFGDKQICSLLSGGLDSSLICGILTKFLGKIKTFSIGLNGSTDLVYAKKVAEFIKSDHTEIILSEEEFLNNIKNTIKIVESYDTTTVRASVGNMLVSKYISENSDCKIVFNGDYSDEVTGGYKYFSKCNDSILFHDECVRLVNDIIYFDAKRSDRCISYFGLESRVPYADKDFVNYYLSIEPCERMCNDKIEKYLLRLAFDNENIIPQDVLWRKKEAFSDGVSSNERSWYVIIQEYIDKNISDEYFNERKILYTHNTPRTKEDLYYREIFNEYYLDCDNVVPYKWMPKWVSESLNPSARVIN